MKEKITEKEWYDEPGIVTTLIIGVLILILIISQAFAIRHHMGIMYVLRSLLNHNSIYIFYLAYFVCLKTKIGKRYFDLINIIITAVQTLVVFASVLNLIQSFSLETIAAFLLQTALFIYIISVLLRKTRVYEALQLERIQLQNVSNEQYFYGVSAFSIILLVVRLISSLTFDHVVLALLESIFYLGLARYLYLYRSYQEEKKLAPLEDDVLEESEVMVEEEKSEEVAPVKKKKETVKKATPKKKAAPKKEKVTQKEEKKDE